MYHRVTLHLPCKSVGYGASLWTNGYAKAYMLIMNELGIECGLVTGIAKNSTGSSGGHAWNYINLDGDYYMVDVTWDDPVEQAYINI